MFEQCTYTSVLSFIMLSVFSFMFLPILCIENSDFKTDCMSWLGSKIKVQMRK